MVGAVLAVLQLKQHAWNLLLRYFLVTFHSSKLRVYRKCGQKPGHHAGGFVGMEQPAVMGAGVSAVSYVPGSWS